MKGKHHATNEFRNMHAISELLLSLFWTCTPVSTATSESRTSRGWEDPCQPPWLCQPSTCSCMGTGHLCCQQQEEHGVGVPWRKVLAKTPGSPLNAATLRRKVGCGSSECGSSHWWWQCCGAHSWGQGGKNSVLLLQQSEPSSARTAHWLGAELSWCHLHCHRGGWGPTCLAAGLPRWLQSDGVGRHGLWKHT